MEYETIKQDYKNSLDKFINPEDEIQEFKKMIYSYPNNNDSGNTSTKDSSAKDSSATAANNEEILICPPPPSFTDASDAVISPTSAVVVPADNSQDSDVEMIDDPNNSSDTNQKSSADISTPTDPADPAAVSGNDKALQIKF